MNQVFMFKALKPFGLQLNGFTGFFRGNALHDIVYVTYTRRLLNARK